MPIAASAVLAATAEPAAAELQVIRTYNIRDIVITLLGAANEWTTGENSFVLEFHSATTKRPFLEDPALRSLALIVRGADTAARQLTPESAGLYALATGFQAIAKDDFDNMAKQFAAYDALYAYCRSKAK